MLNKTYHTIEVTGRGTSQILWVDGYGKEGKVDSSEAAQFGHDYPRSVYLAPKKFYDHLALVRAEMAKLENWNARKI